MGINSAKILRMVLSNYVTFDQIDENIPILSSTTLFSGMNKCPWGVCFLAYTMTVTRVANTRWPSSRDSIRISSVYIYVCTYTQQYTLDTTIEARVNAHAEEYSTRHVISSHVKRYTPTGVYISTTRTMTTTRLTVNRLPLTLAYIYYTGY